MGEGGLNEGQPPEPMPSDGALQRARVDLEAGRLDLARDRVTGFLYTLHRRGDYQEEAYELLGTILYQMRDLPKAGAAWHLTSKEGPEVDAALEALYRRYGRQNINVLKALKPRSPADLYPEVVRERLRALSYRYAPYRPRSNPHVVTELSEESDTKDLRAVDIGCLMLIAFLGLMTFIVVLRLLGLF